MTPPTRNLDAAKRLGVPVEEVASVEQIDDGVLLVAMATGSNVVYRIDGDQVMYQHKPNPELHYDFPVYQPTEDEELAAAQAAALAVESASAELTDEELLALIEARGLAAPVAEDGPEGDTIPDIVNWVRGGPADAEPTDGWPERAAQALAAEEAKGDKARATLVAQLRDLVPEA